MGNLVYVVMQEADNYDGGTQPNVAAIYDNEQDARQLAIDIRDSYGTPDILVIELGNPKGGHEWIYIQEDDE